MTIQIDVQLEASAVRYLVHARELQRGVGHEAGDARDAREEVPDGVAVQLIEVVLRDRWKHHIGSRHSRSADFRPTIDA